MTALKSSLRFLVDLVDLTLEVGGNSGSDEVYLLIILLD